MAKSPIAVIKIPLKPRGRDPRLFISRPPKIPAMLAPKKPMARISHASIVGRVFIWYRKKGINKITLKVAK